MVRLLILAFFIFATAVHASPTAAWKVPLETLAPDHKTNDKIRKLEKPPVESAFFKPGDELWDVSSVLKDKSLLAYGWLESTFEEEEKPRGPWKGEWAIWNGRSGMLVARGSHRDLLTAQLAWNFEKAWNLTGAESKAKPNLVRCRLDWTLPGKAEPFRSTSMICKDNEITKTVDGDVTFEADPSIGFLEPAISTRVAVEWKDGDEPERWEVLSSLDVKDGKRTLLAKHGVGETGWELYLTCREERADGTLAAEARLLETKYGGLQSWPGGGGSILQKSRVPLDDQRSIVWYPIPPEGLSLPLPLPERDLEVPESLSTWIDGPLVSCAKLLREQGIKVDEPGFFAGMDLVTGQLIVVGNGEAQAAVAKLEVQFSPRVEGPVFIEVNPASGNSGITVRNSEKALISKLRGEEAETILQVEPARRASSTSLILEMKVMSGGKERGTLRTATDLVPGQWQTVMEAKSGESVEVLVRAGSPPP